MSVSRHGLDLHRKLLLGVIHLPPLPGSPRYDGAPVDRIAERAREDAETLLRAGFDGWVLENFGDAPFPRDEAAPHVVACLARIASDLPRQDAFTGVNVLRNAASAALGVACACALDAVRINVHCGAVVADQGIIEGRADETLRRRAAWAPHVAVLADVAVKHAAPLGPGFALEDAARDTAYRGLADALIVTGRATGAEADVEDLRRVRRAVPDRPVLVGSGVTETTAPAWWEAASGILVGSAVKREGRAGEPVDAERARRLAAAARGGAA